MQRYFTAEQRQEYSKEAYLFYLGYLTHLLTDIEWVRQVYKPSLEKFNKLFTEKPTEAVWILKKGLVRS